ncbi:MAG: MlaD family protein [Candidatus Adiutrix sp.]|jgi:phospholipid/cholesterol/gamma-HCH transport system substrate-binding protein|nr:MlaD family protein [Candidatus Adiutrix sp.]
MPTPYTRKEKLAGLFFLAGLGLIFLGAVIVGGGRDWFRSYYSYYALYNDGYGLSPGVKVKLRRTDIGLVTKLELTDNNKVKVHLSILAEYADRIKTDCVAAIGSPTFIGSEYVDILPGSPKTTVIPRGGQIPAVERKSIEDYFRDLRLDVMLARAEAIMVNIDSLTAQLQDPAGPFMGMLSDVRRVTSSVAGGEGTLGQLVASDAAFRVIEKILTDVQAITGDFSSVSGSLGESLPPIVGRIGAITREVEQTTRRAPEAMRDARRGLDNANQVLESVKRNFLIRGNLPQNPEPETQTVPARSGR